MLNGDRVLAIQVLRHLQMVLHILRRPLESEGEGLSHEHLRQCRNLNLNIPNSGTYISIHQ